MHVCMTSFIKLLRCVNVFNFVLSIKTLVDNGQFVVGFGMLSITIDEMKEIADAKLIMPPKTSYIEPKLRSGLTMYEF